MSVFVAAFLLIVGTIVGQRSLLIKHFRVALIGGEYPLAVGPHSVGFDRFTLAAGAGMGDFTVDLFYPVSENGGNLRLRKLWHWLAFPTQPLVSRGAEPATGARPLILYFPSWFAKRDESSFTLSNLASHGFVVAALDDIVHLPLPPGGDAEAQHAILDFTSENSFARSRRLAARRVVIEARAGSQVIDALALARRWSLFVDTTRVGVLGYSFGGGAAAALSRIDPRVRAVANLDGSLFGDAAQLGVDTPYLVLFGDTPFHPAKDLVQPDLAARFDAILDQEEVDRQRRDAGRTAHWTFVVDGMRHQDFSDRLIVPALADWRRSDHAWRSETWTAITTVLTRFFETALKHDRSDDFDLGTFPAMLRSLSQAEKSSISDHPK